MALSSVRKIKMYIRFIKFFRLDLNVSSNMNRSAPRVMNNRKFVLEYCFGTHQESSLSHEQCNTLPLRRFSTSLKQENLSCEGSTREMLKELEGGLLKCKDEEVWAVYNEFKNLHGFPPSSTMSKLITGLTYSSDHRSLHKACNLVFKIAKEKSELLQHDCLSRLCLSLSRAQMFVSASKILRLMLRKNNPPSMNVLSSVFVHMVKTEAGTYLASNILLELCDCFHHLSAKKSSFSFKPSTTIFNLVLEACVRFGTSLKGQNIIEVMAQTRVVADAHSVLLFACVYEMNGQRDELKNFKEHVDRVSLPLAQHYGQFYDKFLSLHYKFDDLAGAAGLVKDMHFGWDLRPLQENDDLSKPCAVPIGSPYLKEGLKVQVMFELLQKDSVFHVKHEQDFVVFKNGKLVLSSKGLALLVIKYKRNGRISELSNLLAAIEKEIGKSQGSLCCDVIHACIYSGWLETAHDFLDDMKMSNISIPASTYLLLLNAYRREKMTKEAEALAKQIKRLGFVLDASEEMVVSGCLSGVVDGSHSPVGPSAINRTELADCLVREMEGEDNASSKVYELNSSIFFFCKAKMMEDAQKAYRKLQLLNIQPTVQTFACLIQGYSSLKMYREITILWGDIKRYTDHGCSIANRDLYELLLMNFLRGGYFGRVLEVIGLMKEKDMYVDKWLCKNVFLNLHKNLYRSLRATEAKNEAQKLRIEHVKAFRNWIRNDLSIDS